MQRDCEYANINDEIWAGVMGLMGLKVFANWIDFQAFRGVQK